MAPPLDAVSYALQAEPIAASGREAQLCRSVSRISCAYFAATRRAPVPNELRACRTNSITYGVINERTAATLF
jgi:hypothetical protein